MLADNSNCFGFSFQFYLICLSFNMFLSPPAFGCVCVRDTFAAIVLRYFTGFVMLFVRLSNEYIRVYIMSMAEETMM